MTESYTPFVLFGPSHIAVLLLTILVPLLLLLFVRFHPNPRMGRIICKTLAVFMIAVWASWYLAAYLKGWMNIGNAIPMNLCDWATAVTVITLFWPNQRTYELAYFWALGGTLQGLLTPDTPYDFPEIRFLVFMLYHGTIIAAVLFLTLGERMRPYPSSLPRVVGWSLFYALCAALTDGLLGVDYGFMRAKPANASLYDLMPAWPWYIPVVIAIGLASLLLYYLPFALIDLLDKRKRPMSA